MGRPLVEKDASWETVHGEGVENGLGESLRRCPGDFADRHPVIVGNDHQMGTQSMFKETPRLISSPQLCCWRIRLPPLIASLSWSRS